MKRRAVLIALGLLGAAAFVTSCVSLRLGTGENAMLPSTPKDFSFAYWLNGWRKGPEDPSPDILCIETGHYGFTLDVDDLRSPQFGVLEDDADYEATLDARSARLGSLADADLAIELKVDGTVYRAVTSKAGTDTDLKRLQSVRMWESGRIAQTFDLQQLAFRDDEGNGLTCSGSLDLAAWPDSLTFTAEVSPDIAYTEGPCIGASGPGLCIIDNHQDIPHSPELEPETLTAEMWFNIPATMDRSIYGWLLCKNDNEWGTGNYGIMYRHGTVIAVLNNAGGRNEQVMINQHGKLSPGKWHHLALTYDGKTMRFYMNGQQQGSKDIATPRTRAEGLLRIGKRADGNFDTVNGLYDQVRIWNRALSAAEVAEHTKQPGKLTSRKGLVFETQFDDGPEVTPPVWTDAELSIRFKAAGNDWHAEKRVAGEWEMGEKQSLTLSCDMQTSPTDVSIQVSTPSGQEFPVRFDQRRNCHVAEVKGLKRSFPGGYVKITEYDEFDIRLDCAAASERVPFLLDFYNPASITGIVPVLCHADGTPTGIPVQLSKNWHYTPLGSYLRAYSLVPVTKGKNHYRLRMVYGFHGTLPSASHAQLCLVGYGGNGRWDQLALGTGGESITFDPDNSLTDVAVCDVRLPFGQNGKDGNPWGWTDAGWGGDWLGIFGKDGKKLTFAAMKVAYFAHGPCLGDVGYRGAYGSDRAVLLDARIQLPRTDDYGRTFQALDYRFQKEVEAADTYLMRRHARAFDACIAYGNADGLIAEKRVEGDLKKGDLLVAPTELTGPGPWWIAFPGRTRRAARDWGFGYVSLVIRGYEASFGGKTHTNPFLMARIEDRQEDEAKLETWLVPPPGVTTYKPGDSVKLDTEWVHLHRNADDYGGPNEAYRQHLEENPQSWKTTYREAKGNDLTIEVDGGQLVQGLPIVIRTEQRSVDVTIKGGVGYVPIRFEGLQSVRRLALYEIEGRREMQLDQSVHGNDFWQTDFNTATGTYSVTFNLPLDGKPTSTWRLKSGR